MKSKLFRIITCDDGTVTFIRTDNAVVRKCTSWLSRMRLDRLIVKYNTQLDYVEHEFLPRITIDVRHPRRS